jgi:hypothetical protein
VRLTLDGQETPVEIKLGYRDATAGRYYCQTSGQTAPVLVLDTVMDKIPRDMDKLKEEAAATPPPTPPVGGSPIPEVKEAK